MLPDECLAWVRLTTGAQPLPCPELRPWWQEPSALGSDRASRGTGTASNINGMLRRSKQACWSKGKRTSAAAWTVTPRTYAWIIASCHTDFTISCVKQLVTKLDGRADRIESLAAALAAAEDKASQLVAALDAATSQHTTRTAELEATVAAMQVHWFGLPPRAAH